MMRFHKVKPLAYLQLLQTFNGKNVLSQVKQFHNVITHRVFAKPTTFRNKLINMYVKCDNLVDARKLFDGMTERDVSSWNTIIAGYKRHGCPHETLTLLYEMQQTGVKPDQFTFATILPACAKLRALEQGIDIHQNIVERGFLSDVVIASALVDMYAKCGNIRKARQLFDKMPGRNVISWNAMIVGYTQNGLFDEASRLFNEMPQPDIISWNAMIAGYAQNGFAEKAYETFKNMELAGLEPNSTTFVSIIPACAKMGALEHGMDIHQRVIEGGFLSDAIVANALIDMYAKCGSVHKARQLFDKMPQRDVVSWTEVIAGYAQNGHVEKALETFKQMRLAGVKPDSTTFASVLSACAKIKALEQGMDIHQRIIENGLLSDVVVGNALIDMYAKCGRIQKAHELFDEIPRQDVFSWNALISVYAQSGVLDQGLRLLKNMPHPDVVSWNAMVAGYTQNGFAEKALETFDQMQLTGLKPNSATFVSILPACAKMGALEQGIHIHQTIIESGLLADVKIVNALIDMYAKCGSIHKARELFDRMPHRNVVSWTAMIVGYAQNGFCKDALKIFELMKHSGTYLDNVSFACVLFACSHAGLVDEGCEYFNCMIDSYCNMPMIDHYVCMVDLLGRAGFLEESLNFIIKMPIKPMVVVWMCLLGACRLHKNIGLGTCMATLLLEMDPKNAPTHVLLSNMYAEVGRWGEVQKVRRLMKDRRIEKIPGCSWIEGHKMVHAFCVGDRSHPQTQEIYATIEKLSWKMKEAGHIPDSRHVLNDVEEEEKELFLWHHSEKLAIAFGLLNTPPGTTIRIVKNLRVCVDCHTAAKFISKIVVRQIVVRDANRFHHFKQGQCSCGDYW
ncbi:pentatricopeptide repeat-containing protein At2g13600 [Cryptomeria japonica]|uniref:pentatricopeptide repeat-containing protein At2g13600 n=1 Tax=Cryptomeria japonica TaxID=3369 RepID=UPI0027DAA732|nr:pentatricopeptide repeat-containing protein At2g13600 [Cryptomeria japonica]